MDELHAKLIEALPLARDYPHVKEALQNALTFYEAAKVREAAARGETPTE